MSQRETNGFQVNARIETTGFLVIARNKKPIVFCLHMVLLSFESNGQDGVSGFIVSLIPENYETIGVSSTCISFLDVILILLRIDYNSPVFFYS